MASAVTATVLLGGGAAVVGARANSAGGLSALPDDVIAPGVNVAGIPVGGMSRDEAAQRVRDWARTAAATRPVTLTAPVSGRKWNLALSDVGGRFDVTGAVNEAYQVGRGGNWLQDFLTREQARQSGVTVRPAFALSESALKKRLAAAIADQVRIAPRNAQARMDEDGMLQVTRPERKGVRLDVDATAQALLKNGTEPLRNGGRATLVIAEEMPRVTQNDLGAVSHLLGSYSTSYGSSSSNRRHNVEKAASHINGTLLAPGDVFSYNDVVGPRAPRLGWRNAPTYQDGQVVPGPGGGICQVSTTLYNAALFANLKIVRRSSHSMPVHYVPAGRDATVSYGSTDFQFENNTNGPVYVAARARRGRLTLSLYGKEPTGWKDVRVVSGGRWFTRTGGFGVSTYRIVTAADGTERRERLGSSSYRPLVEAQEADKPAATPRRRRVARRRSSPPPRAAAPQPAATPAPAAAPDEAPIPDA
jgi:vancomycin resistance protein YoaR